MPKFLFFMIKYQLIFFLVFFISCNSRGSVESKEHFSIVEEIKIQDNHFVDRIYKNDLYSIVERVSVPEYVGNIYQLRSNAKGIYFNDKESVYRYKNGEFETVYTPGKGSGPNEVPQIFRFDIKDDDVIAIAGYPDLRLLLYQIQSDTNKLIQTQYRGNALIDKNFNFYGEHSGNSSSYMITKFDVEGGSILSFGNLFNNQDMSLTMFDFYWDYNEKFDVIIIGFMYAGYYASIDTEGNLKYMVESIQHPGQLPTLVNRNNMQYIDNEVSIMRGLTTNNDEIHVYTAKAMNRQGDIYGALIDVMDVQTGRYQFSYILEEPLHWPLVLLDDYSIVSINEDYELIKWQRNFR